MGQENGKNGEKKHGRSLERPSKKETRARARTAKTVYISND